MGLQLWENEGVKGKGTREDADGSVETRLVHKSKRLIMRKKKKSGGVRETVLVGGRSL